MRISQGETAILRTLGQRYMEYASLPVNQEKLRMWKALNRGDMERPMVTIDQLPWHELTALEPDKLKCGISTPYWREIECNLRRTIYQWENFPADMILEPYITVKAAVSASRYGIACDEDVIIGVENETASSHYYKAVIKEPEDIEKIKDMEVTVDNMQSALNLQEAEAVFKGIAPVKLSNGLQFHLGVWDFLSTLMGVESIYFDLADRPEFLHSAMRRITDATIAGIKAANDLDAHNDTSGVCHCSYVYTDELLPGFGVGKGSISRNSWAYGMAQLFTSVSPDVTREFELPYVSEMAEYFGMIYYGCCEGLDDRLDIIRQIPNIKKVSCSPWSNRDAFAERLDKKLIMSNKPSPAYLTGRIFDEDAARSDIAHTCKAAKANGLNLELLMKDISTTGSDLSRLKRWHEIAMELVTNY